MCKAEYVKMQGNLVLLLVFWFCFVFVFCSYFVFFLFFFFLVSLFVFSSFKKRAAQART